MPAAAAVAEAAPSGADAPKRRSRKKLVIYATLLLVVLLVLGVGAALVLKNRAAKAAALALDDDAAAPIASAAKADRKHPPTFLPLDPFVVNLADRDADRYAQIGITLELDSAAFADEMKAYMPAVRNAVLLILAQKTARELLDAAGKEQLAAEIQRESVRPMGIVMQAPTPVSAAPANAAGSAARPKPVVRSAPVEANPVRHVHFSNFIIQ